MMNKLHIIVKRYFILFVSVYFCLGAKSKYGTPAVVDSNAVTVVKAKTEAEKIRDAAKAEAAARAKLQPEYLAKQKLKEIHTKYDSDLLAVRKFVPKMLTRYTKLPSRVEILQAIVLEKESVAKLLKGIDLWEDNLTVSDTQVNSLLQRSEAYAVERKYRRELVEHNKRLVELTEQLMQVEAKRMDGLLHDIEGVCEILDKPLSVKDQKELLAKEKIDYDPYEVNEPMTLKEIAALKSVYGDANKWPTIYRYNMDVISNKNNVYAGDIVVPKGITLKIILLEKNKLLKSENPKDLKDEKVERKHSGN